MYFWGPFRVRRRASDLCKRVLAPQSANGKRAERERAKLLPTISAAAVSIQNGHFTNHHLPSSKGKRIMFCVTFCYLILKKIVTFRSFRNNVCFSSSHAIFSSSYLLKKTKLKLISYHVCNKITYLGA